MKMLLIHSKDVEVVKHKEATSSPQEFPENFIKMESKLNLIYKYDKIDY